MVWALQPRSTNPEESPLTPRFPPSTLLRRLVTAFAPSTCPPPLCKRSPGLALLVFLTPLAWPRCLKRPFSSLLPRLGCFLPQTVLAATASASSPACRAPRPTTAPRARPRPAPRAPTARFLRLTPCPVPRAATTQQPGALPFPPAFLAPVCPPARRWASPPRQPAHPQALARELRP